jgi:hypothetical protein
MIHFIVGIQQAIHTQKKLNKKHGDKRKHSSHQSGKPVPPAQSPPEEEIFEPVARREPFWKRWFSSGR